MFTAIWEGITVAAIVEGVVIGVSSGLIVSGILWWREVRKRKAERRDQIEYIAQIVALYRGLILGESNATDEGARLAEVTRILAITGMGRFLEPEDLRDLSFKTLKTCLGETLVGRASRLSYDEKGQIELLLKTTDSVLRVRERVFENPSLDEQKVLSQTEDGILKTMFDEFEKIGWLKDHSQESNALKRLWGRLWGTTILFW